MSKIRRFLKFLARLFESFWSAGMLIALLIGITASVFNVMDIQFNFFVGAIIGVALWIVMMLSVRRYRIHVDQKSVIRILNTLNNDKNTYKRFFPLEGNNPFHQFWSRIGFTPTKLMFIKESISNNVFSEILGEIKYDIDQAINSWYMPLHALVWSLPALGFLGTAWHMRETIIIFLEQGFTEKALNLEILHEIGPELILSFSIICLALLFAVVTYIATALTIKADTEAAQPMKDFLASALVPQTGEELSE